MPALEVFWRKWRIGSDDLVYPNILSLCIRIVWFSLFGYVIHTYDKKYKCDDEHLLKIYLSILTGVHVLMCLTEVVIVFLSARGTMANPEPRKYIYIVIYVESVVFVAKFCWDVVGVLWAYDPSIDCPTSHPILVLARCVLLWNLFSSVSMAFYFIVRVAFCRLACCGPTSAAARHKKLGKALSGNSSHGLLALSSGEMRKHRRRDSIWQCRIKWLLCCFSVGKIESGNLFVDIGTVMADSFTYFRGYVPSDVAAGIALVAMEHTAENTNDDLYKDLHTPLDFRNTSVCADFNRVVYYVKYAVAAYGWRGDACKSLLKGLALSFSRMHGEGKKEAETVFKAKGDPTGWNIDSLKKRTRVNDADILYASYDCEVFCPAFYVVVDHTMQSVVIAVRGTFTIRDALTDLSAHPALLTLSDRGDLYGHKGMIASAHALQVKLESERILTEAFTKNPGYGLVLVGHSLGAGVASLLAILLKGHFENLHCYAYCPPGGLLCKTAVPKTRSFITSIVSENDMIPRLSLQNAQSLSERVLHNIQTSAVPKYRILLSSALQWMGLCGSAVRKMGNRRVSATTMAILKEPLLNSNFDVDTVDEPIYDDIENIYDEVAEVKAGKRSDHVTGKSGMQVRERMHLFLPGKIIHLTKDPSKSRGFCGMCKRRRLRAHWTAQSEFSELVIEKNMLKCHSIFYVEKLLIKLQKQEKLHRK